MGIKLTNYRPRRRDADRREGGEEGRKESLSCGEPTAFSDVLPTLQPLTASVVNVRILFHTEPAALGDVKPVSGGLERLPGDADKLYTH